MIFWITYNMWHSEWHKHTIFRTN